MKMPLKLSFILLVVLSTVTFFVTQTDMFLVKKSNPYGLSEKQVEEKPWEKIFVRLTNERLKQIGYPILKEKTLPAGSKEIRVWTRFAFLSPGVLILEKTDSKWKAIHIPPTNSVDYKTTLPNTLGEPKSGWDKLIEKLDTLNIEQMPDMSELGIGPPGPDFEVVVIEVRNSDGYRNYMYQGLELDRIAKMEYPKKVKEIVSVLSVEFGLDMYGQVPTK